MGRRQLADADPRCSFKEDRVLMLTMRIAGILFGSELLFILLAQYKGTEGVRNVSFIVAFVLLLRAAVRYAGAFSYLKLLAVSVVSSVACIVLHDLAGSIWFPGIIKDLDPLSADGFAASFYAAICISSVLFLCASIVKAFLALMERTRKQP